MSGTGGGAGVFGGSQNCQGTTLGAYQSCQIFSVFSPTATGPVTGSASGAVNGQAFSLLFSGTGIDRFLVSPKALDFGEIALGLSSSAQTISVTNVSGSSAVVEMSGGGGWEFGGVQNCQGVTLAAGGSCQIFYTFTPSAAGIRTATPSGTINGQPFSLTLKGIGTGGVLTTAAPTIAGTADVKQTLTAQRRGGRAEQASPTNGSGAPPRSPGPPVRPTL
ncbi:hypothetical protein BH09ACT6_BH09ACT6_12080 [soil metagenome]